MASHSAFSASYTPSALVRRAPPGGVCIHRPPRSTAAEKGAPPQAVLTTARGGPGVTVWTPDGETQRHQPRAAQHAPQEEGAPGAGTLLRPSSVRAGGEQV